MKRSNRFLYLDDLLVGEQVIAALAEDNIFLVQRINRYISFAKESKEGRQVFMKLIRYLETKKSKKEFMNFIVSVVYKQRVLIEDKDQLYLLEKMIEYEEGEVYMDGSS